MRLAESLELPLRDRNKLLASAGYLPAYPQTPLGDPSVSTVYEAMCQILVGRIGRMSRSVLNARKGRAPARA